MFGNRIPRKIENNKTTMVAAHQALLTGFSLNLPDIGPPTSGLV
jgi:hypothetical protein